MSKCKDVMGTTSRPCLPSDTVFEAANIMRNRGVSVVPVVASKEKQELVGLLAERDIAVRVVAQSLTPQTIVRDVMTTNLATCGPEDDVEKALELMDELEIHHIPIVDAAGTILGIVHKDAAA